MTNQPPLCPSTTGDSQDARIIGFIGPDGVVAPITTPIALTDAMREAIGKRPESVFRLSGPCMASKCANWENQQCGLIARMRDEVDRRGVASAMEAKLPGCGIRPDCVWWRQSGPEACRVCPHVIYNPA